MSEFLLEMFTPKKEFFSGQVEAVVCQATDGEIGVLKGHHPMTAVIVPGEMRMKINGEWKRAFCAEGFLEVRNNKLVVFSHMCEWPEDIDEARANAAIERENEQLRNAESLSEYRQAEIDLQRMMAMLQVRNRNQSLNMGGR